MTYRIYTQRFDNLAHLASMRFDGFTLINTVGYWQGQPEDSTIIEIVGDEVAAMALGDDLEPRILALAEDIRVANAQQSVLVTRSKGTVEFVTAQAA